MIEGLELLSRQIKRNMAFSFVGKIMYAVIDSEEELPFEVTVRGDTTLSEERDKVKDEISLIITFLDNMYYKTKV
jgi:hypothetical protein